MTEHLTDRQLIEYVYRTLTDDQRAEMDHHLAACTACRAELAGHEAVLRRIHNNIIARRNTATPPTRLTYGAIAARVRPPNRMKRLGGKLHEFSFNALAVVALIALAVLLISMFSGGRQGTVNSSPTLVPTAASVTPMRPSLVWKIQKKPDSLNRPTGITLDSQGNLYVIDSGNNRILKYDRDGQFLAQWGDTGSGEGQFRFVWWSGIASDAQDNIYVVDRGNFRVSKFDRTGKFLLQWGGEGNGVGQFEVPTDIAVDSQGNVYVVDVSQARVHKFDADGKFLLQWGAEKFAPGRSFNPLAIAIDREDFIYLMDESYGAIQVFDRQGKFIVKWALKCGDNQRVAPISLTTDSSSKVYVTDYYSNRICKYDSNGQFLKAWGNKGMADGQFDMPYGIAVDAQGNVYVADYNNHRVLKFSQPQ